VRYIPHKDAVVGSIPSMVTNDSYNNIKCLKYIAIHIIDLKMKTM